MSHETATGAGGNSRALNALIGAVAAVVLFFLPFQTLVGGAVAGYLQGPDTDEGLRVGALAGVFLLVPAVLVVLLFGGAFLTVIPFVHPVAAGVGALAVFVLLVLLAVAALYVVGLCALGGVLGAYLNREL